MAIEVELKFPLPDRARLEEELAARGAIAGATLEQTDRYFAHPSRDFAATDEALRLRTVGDATVITYKGPKLDAVSKSRHEIELPLAASDATGAAMSDLLTALGFQAVTTVHKVRRPYHLCVANWPIEIALDTVTGVGDYVELEIAAEAEQLDAARSALLALASDLGLAHSERRSYLELLIAARP